MDSSKYLSTPMESQTRFPVSITDYKSCPTNYENIFETKSIPGSGIFNQTFLEKLNFQKTIFRFLRSYFLSRVLTLKRNA